MKIPATIETGMFTNFIMETPFPCAILINVVNNTITYTSSTDAPARISCGIPFFVPYPSSISFTILGTTTAGETAANTAPIIAASNTVKCNNLGPNISIPSNSKVAGTKHIITAGLPIFFNPEISRLKPARVKIIIKAIFLISDEIPSSESSNNPNT